MDYNSLKKRIISSIIIIIFFLVSFIYLQDYFNILFLTIYLIIFYEIYKYFALKKIITLLYLYIFLSLILLELYIYYYLNIYDLMFVFFVLSIFDSLSYLIGSLFGKKKIFNYISPNKSYVGLFSGIIGTVLITFYINYFYSFYNNYECIILTAMFIFLSFWGDVIESFFKRISFIKNSSNFIPGHGGFFDRFDSFIFCVYGLFAYNFFNT